MYSAMFIFMFRALFVALIFVLILMVVWGGITVFNVFCEVLTNILTELRGNLIR